jgi:membrane protein DedA with SNARE-associated domain
MDSLYYLVTHYGYLAIFVLLMVGIFGIPLPDEFLVAFIGYLIFQREMHFWPAALAVISGGITGISVNYVVGRTIGKRLCKGLGYFFPEKREKLNYVTDWLGNSGGPVLFLAYFLPGARHWATVGAGVVKLPPWVCAVFAYPAVVLWSLSYLFLGYHLGKEGACSPQNLSPYLPVISVVIILSGLLWCFFIRTKRLQRWCSLKKKENYSLNR